MDSVTLLLFAALIVAVVYIACLLAEVDRQRARTRLLENQMRAAVEKINILRGEDRRLRNRILGYQMRLNEVPGIQKVILSADQSEAGYGGTAK